MARSTYTSRAVAFVERHPGCSKWDLASHLTRDARRCPSKQYYLVNTQIRLGHIVAIRRGNRYELYTPEQYAAIQEERRQDDVVRASVAHDYREEFGVAPAWAN